MKHAMAAVGNLAAGLAHEIGNPLAAISGSVQMLSNAASKNSSEGKLLDIILQESRRLDRTIKDFLSYARPKPRHAMVFDVATKLDENLELFRNRDEVGAHHELEIRLDPTSAIIEADQPPEGPQPVDNPFVINGSTRQPLQAAWHQDG